MSQHPALAAGRVAVVTGASSGIGLAAARRFASFGMKVCLADVDVRELAAAADVVRELAHGGAADVLAIPTDVSRLDDVERLAQAAYEAFGEVGMLMNNAGVGLGGGALESLEWWRRAMEVNLWGVIHGVQRFVPRMLGQGTPCVVVNTGSKQGITCPPGNLAYNVSKAGLKVFTEGLQHELRNTAGCRISAHLLIPGWTSTAIVRKTLRARRGEVAEAEPAPPPDAPHPPGAWTADQVVDALLVGLDRGDFYILCPDNDVTREMDQRRILWAAGDIVHNRPPLSRWHPDYVEAFEQFSRS